MNSVPVLMYHALEESSHPAGSADAGEQRYVLQIEQFSDQMAFLHHEGYRTCLLSELLGIEKWPDKAIMITFDDGHASNLTLALPLLQRYGFKAEFFITTGWLGTPRYLKDEDVTKLHDAGMQIGSHGASHAFLGHLDEIELERELKDSMDILTQLTGKRIVSLSAPGGRVGPGAASIAKKLGYQYIFTSRPGHFSVESTVFSVPRLALHKDSDLGGFASMVHGDRAYLEKMIRRDNLLRLAKKTLGEKGYQVLRKMMLGMS